MLKISSQFYNMIIQSSISGASWKYYTVLNTLQWFFTFPFFNVHAVIWQVGEKVVDFLNIMWYIWFQENKQLQDLNEDLNAQLLTRCINEGKTLVNDTKAKSLATELEHLTKEEVPGLIVCCSTEILYIGLKYVCMLKFLQNFFFSFWYHFRIVFIAHILNYMTVLYKLLRTLKVYEIFIISFVLLIFLFSLWQNFKKLSVWTLIWNLM